MKLTVRELGYKDKYAEVIFEDSNCKYDCGIMNIKERKELAEHLIDVVDELLYELNKEEQ